jgi:hypothetical protein
MSWVIYLKFLSTGKFVLIEYLTLIYIFAYFCNVIWLLYQLIIYACLEANFREKYIFCNFFSSFNFLVWSVRTDLFLRPDEISLAVRCPSSSRTNGKVTRPDGISTGLRLASLSLPYAHLCIFIDLSCHVVCFSHGFLPRFWHSLHISSHSMVFDVSSFVLLKFCAFKNIGIFVDWNTLLRYCAWKSYHVCVLGGYCYIRAIWIAIFAFIIQAHPNCKLS